jgi:uncharacterized protein
VAESSLHTVIRDGAEHRAFLLGGRSRLPTETERSRRKEWGMAGHEHPNVRIVREGFEAFRKGELGWMDEHLSDDVVWHVGGNSKWSGSYEGKAKVLDLFSRQAQAMGPPEVDIHDVVGGDDHVVVLGTASASDADGRRAEWKYAQIFHIRDGKATEVWGMAENDADVDPFLDGLPN